MNPFEELPEERDLNKMSVAEIFAEMNTAVWKSTIHLREFGQVLSDNSLDATKKMTAAFNRPLNM